MHDSRQKPIVVVVLDSFRFTVRSDLVQTSQEGIRLNLIIAKPQTFDQVDPVGRH